MKTRNLKDIDDLFSHKIRLGITTLLAMNESCDFSTLKKELELSDGNLGAHLSVLEKAGYIDVEKQFVNRRPKSTYRLTSKGREAFMEHLKQLESIIKKVK